MTEVFDPVKNIELMIEEYRKSSISLPTDSNIERISVKLWQDMSGLRSDVEKREYLEKVARVLVMRDDNEDGIFDFVDFKF